VEVFRVGLFQWTLDSGRLLGRFEPSFGVSALLIFSFWGCVLPECEAGGNIELALGIIESALLVQCVNTPASEI